MNNLHFVQNKTISNKKNFIEFQKLITSFPSEGKGTWLHDTRFVDCKLLLHKFIFFVLFLHHSMSVNSVQIYLYVHGTTITFVGVMWKNVFASRTKIVIRSPFLAGKKEARNRNDRVEKLMTMTSNMLKEKQDRRKNDVNMSRMTYPQRDVSFNFTFYFECFLT